MNNQLMDIVLNQLGGDIARLSVQLRIAQAELALAQAQLAELEATEEDEEDAEVQ